jgi:photosystem II stability/assembly factor-like uncharacterized protein
MKTFILLFILFQTVSSAQYSDTIHTIPVQYRRGIPLQEGYQTYSEKYAGKNLSEEKRRLFPLESTGIWTELNPGVPRADYLGIHFVNTDTGLPAKQTGWACGDLGTIIKTTDEGINWTTEQTNTTIPLLKVSSYSGQIIISTGYDGLILRSGDGGETFEQVPGGVGNGIDLWGLQMLNDTLGWVCGMNQTLLRTTDSGFNWQLIDAGLNQHYWSLDFLNEQLGMVACDGGKILKTTDGGNAWTQLQAGDNRALYTIDIIDPLHIAAAGEGGKMVYSEDGGLTWTEHNNLGFYPEINSISFVDADTGYVVGGDFGLRKTTNRGNSWFVQGFNDIGEYQIDLHQEGFGYAAGTNLRLDRTLNGFDNWQRLIMNDNFVDVSFVSVTTGYIIGTTYTGWPFFKTTDGGENWFTVPNYPDSIMGNLSTVLFLDSLHGFLGGDALIYTTDGGESWHKANGIANSIKKLFFVNNQTGWAVVGTKIYKTTDGGENWVEQLNDVIGSFSSVFFVDSLNGWVSGGRPYKTTDGGAEWIEQTNTTIWNSDDVYFKNSDEGWFAKYSSISPSLYKTADGGINWTAVNKVNGARKFYFFPDPVHWLIIGFSKYYITNDYGNTWIEFTSDVQSGLVSFYAPTNNLGYAVGNDGLVLNYNDTTYIPVELTSFSIKAVDNNVLIKWTTATETNNSGFEVEKKVDSRQPTGGEGSPEGEYTVSSEWKVISFVEGNSTTALTHSYSFTDKNVFPGRFKYRLKQIDFDGSFNYSKEIEVSVSALTKFTLEQNYPNPFNPETEISFTIPEETNVSIKLYDITGREIRVLVNEKKQPGYYTIKLKGGELSSGVYFYRLNSSSGFSAVKKLILLK